MTSTTSRLPLQAGEAVAAGPPLRAARSTRTAKPAQPGFLEDKLQIPQPSLPLLRRRRLIELIEQCSAHRVTLVSGPAGAGKTVACASWAMTAPAARPVAWLTADRQDREPAGFWAYVRATLARARTVPAEAARALEDVPAERFPLVLVEAAQLFTEPVVLVLDDVHELAGGEAVDGLDLLIRHAPPALRLVLSGRSQPGLQLARLRVSGELAEVRAQDLACSPQEADAYFRMLGLRIEPDERDQLLQRTEGWMAGVRLAAMRASAHQGEPGWAHGIAGDEPEVTDYMADEVLARLPERTRLFLLRTSVAPSVSGDLADALTGEPGGARTLDLLSRENSFVETLDQDGGSYRYHPLLRDVLAAQLRRQLPQEIPILLRRAARWHREHGGILAALRSAAQAGDWDYGAHVLADAGPVALMSSGPAELDRVLALFPAQARADDAAVAAACAAGRLWSGDPEGAAAHLDSAQRALGRLGEQARMAVEPGLAAMRVMQAASQDGADPGLLARAAALAEKAQGTASTPAEHRAIGLLWFALGCAQLRRLAAGPARQVLLQADRQLAAGGLTGLQARCRGWWALAQAWQGQLTEAQQAAADPVPAAGQQAADPAVPGGGRWPATLASAQVSLARDELGAARQLLDQVDQAAADQLPGEPPAAVLTALARARVLMAGGDTAAARSVLIRLRERAGPADAALGQTMAVLDAEIALRSGDTGRARITLGVTEDGEPAERADVRLAHGRLLLAEGSFAAAAQMVEPLLADGAAAASLPQKIAALLAAAIAQRRLGQAGQAVQLLEQALALAEPDGDLRSFLDAGQAARSAITVLIPPDSRGAAFAARILDRFASQLPPAAEAPDQPEVALTDSELAVLRFLPSHMTNQEIAEALFLSINTVKTHLRSAYRKLGVSSRRQAIGRGRRLELL